MTDEQKAIQVIERDIPVADWNLYIFQFSDGDNCGEDSKECQRLLVEQLLPKSNLFCYGQVQSPYGSGDYIRELNEVGGQARESGAQRNPEPGSDLRLDQDVPRQGAVATEIVRPVRGTGTFARPALPDNSVFVLSHKS